MELAGDVLELRQLVQLSLRLRGYLLLLSKHVLSLLQVLEVLFHVVFLCELEPLSEISVKSDVELR